MPVGGFTGRESVEAGAGTIVWSGSGTIVHVTNIRIRRMITKNENTDNSAIERTYRKGLGSSSGTMQVFHSQSTPPVAEGSTGTLTFTAYTGRSYTIKIMIEDYEVNWNIDGMCEVTYTWVQTGTGASSDFAAV